MSFPRYPEYKDSGVEWLGEVPDHWEVVRVRWLCEIKKRIVGELGFDVLSITQRGIRIKDTESNDGQLSMDYSKYQLVEVGDFAMNHMDLLTGYVDISPVQGVTSPDYRVFSLRNPVRCHAKFFLYLFQNGYLNKVFYPFGQGSSQLGRWRLPTEQFNDFWFPVPSFEEQSAIATFLDRETAKIDALVAEQEKLIALLQEKRQAVISHAVTKGLDPNVPMKDSGVEWLGEVPEHWEVKRLKQLSDEPLKYGANEAAELDDPSLPRFVRITDVTEGGSLREETFRSLPREIAEPFLLREGDVLLARSGGTVGKSFMYQRHWGEACFAGYLIRVRLSQRLCAPQWLNYFCRTNSYWSYVLGSQIQSTIQNVSAEKYANIFLPVPAIEEQQRVIECLDQATSKIDALVTEARTAITLLQERRTALISAAVTGQIDVRGLAGGANAPDSIAASAYTACAGG
ncbi:MAG TPA: restriction endonuclease subunit S [Acidovorax sp.]|jgi:type I restriction enzyme S subunit|nr:restriction endonuclease subunit S [Acidovorax sp.]